MEIKEQRVQDILAQYNRENWEQSVPQLGEEEISRVYEYMQHNDMHKVLGSILVNTKTMIYGEGFSVWLDGLPSISMVLSYSPNHVAELDRQQDRVVGPYIFEDGTFSSKGIAIWGLRHITTNGRP